MELPTSFVPCKAGEAYHPRKPGLDASGKLNVDDVARLEAYHKREWIDTPSWEFMKLPPVKENQQQQHKPTKKPDPVFWFKFDTRDSKKMVILRCFGKLQSADDVIPLCRHFNKVFKKRKHFDLVVDLNGFHQLDFKQALQCVMQFLVGPSSASVPRITTSNSIKACQDSKAVQWFQRVAILRTKTKDDGDLFNRLKGLAASRIFFPIKELRTIPVGVFQNKKEVDGFLNRTRIELN